MQNHYPFPPTELILYDLAAGTFTNNVSSGLFPCCVSCDLMQTLRDRNMLNPAELDRFSSNLASLTHAPLVQTDEFCFHLNDETSVWYRVQFILSRNDLPVTITFTEISDGKFIHSPTAAAAKDPLTGLSTREVFQKDVERTLSNDLAGANNGEYAVVYLNIFHFKAINDLFGAEVGDQLLVFLSNQIQRLTTGIGNACRMDSDRFCLFVKMTREQIESLVLRLIDEVNHYLPNADITCNAGIYLVTDSSLSAESMIGRAIMAQLAIKGSYSKKLNYFEESLRTELLSEQETISAMAAALSEKQFLVYLQPQYNHSTGMMIGAEALIRWDHPERGLLYPGSFLPVFEKNGFISSLDLYVFETVCAYIRKCLDERLKPVPISVNLTRKDIFINGFIEHLEEIRQHYGVPARYIHVEITESALVGNAQHVNEIIQKLHSFGYVVEMDDFGSGYSSLNLLKDVETDILKLDMDFLSEGVPGNRGGTIVSSVVRMAKWLNMPVIAEGVETAEQADFLKSINCDFVQGFLYSHAIPQNEFTVLLRKNVTDGTIPRKLLHEQLKSQNFCTPGSLETLIFNNLVGGAAILEYQNGKIEFLRVNRKFVAELGMNHSERDLIKSDPRKAFDDANWNILMGTVQSCIDTSDEKECETWLNVTSECCGTENICLRSCIRLIGMNDDQYMLYVMIRNITAEKNIAADERRFHVASEQANIYYWEYNVNTREMRPCFRCMRDLGFSSLVVNYPEPAIAAGIIPPDYADMYRDWHRKIAEGAKSLEAVIPLTVGRVPFHVRYTTEFDDQGRPVKAYGSAALVADSK